MLILANNRRQQKVTQQRMQAGQTFALYGSGSFESGFVTASFLGGDTGGQWNQRRLASGAASGKAMVRRLRLSGQKSGGGPAA